ncbi:peptidase inhibitor family I36 protein [Streptomyces sp. NPDC001985]|uniref:peptidase inhibitor family I36 protein n=1 Tax=Streptomyces sp. NPDC001985 TaxID=3154406 RepID=UPI00331BA25F
MAGRARRFGMMVLGLVTVVGTALAAGPSATAAAAPEECGKGEFCLYETSEGGQVQRLTGQVEGDCIPTSMTLADGTVQRARMVTNRGDLRVVRFNSDDCSGKSAGSLPLFGTSVEDGGPKSFRPIACAIDKICFWENENFSGTKVKLDYADSCSPIGIEGRAVWNLDLRTVSTYEGWVCVGAGFRGNVALGGLGSLTYPVNRISRAA